MFSNKNLRELRPWPTVASGGEGCLLYRDQFWCGVSTVGDQAVDNPISNLLLVHSCGRFISLQQQI